MKAGMVFRIMAVLVPLVVAGTLVPGSAAGASPSATLALSPLAGPPGSFVQTSGGGFQPGETVRILFDRTPVGRARVGLRGRFHRRVMVPLPAHPGDHTVEAYGLSSGLVARATFLVRTDWLQGCDDSGRSCYNPVENVIASGNVAKLAQSWAIPIGASGSGSPVYYNGDLFAGGADGLSKLDATTGAIIINYKSGPVLTTPGVIKGFDPQPDPPGKVVFGSSDGNVYAFDTTNDTQLWQVSIGSAPTSPLVIQGIDQPDAKVLVGAGNTLYAFDQDGVRLWAAVMEGGDISKGGAVMIDNVDARVAVSAGNTLNAVNTADGSVAWSVAFSRVPLGDPSVGNLGLIPGPNILVGDAAGELYSVDPASGRMVAQFTADRAVTASPAIGDPNQSDPWVFVGDVGGNIYAFDNVDAFPPPVWQAVVGGPIDGPPVIANGLVYVGTDPPRGDPLLSVLDAATGRVLFQTVLGGRMASEASVADGMVMIATSSGEIASYQTPDT
jgi:outer membrane protein assembly factor BamB